MPALFVALGIAIITLLALLLWFVPHLLHQQAANNAAEAARLRDMLLEVLNEQETVTRRQAELSTAIAHLQEQLEHIVGASNRAIPAVGAPTVEQEAIRQLEERISALQNQIQHWLDTRARRQRQIQAQDNEAWAHLMSLLAAIQDRLGQLAVERMRIEASPQMQALLDHLERELHHLHAIADDITALQQRLQHSLSAYEPAVSRLKVRAGNTTD